MNKKEWLQFFKLILAINDIEKETFEKEIVNFQKTNDKDLLKLVNLIHNIG